MDTLFLRLANMSFSAGWLIGAVILIRLLFKKAPKWIYCLLWGLVALRLILPFSFESKISLVPSTEFIPESSILSTAPVIDTGIEPIDNAVNPIIAESLAPNPGDSVNPLQVILGIASYLWIVGIAVLLLYSFISWLKLKFQVRIRLRYRDNIYFCDQIDSPFILGVLRPKIYIPSGFTEEQQAYIIAHEKAHLKRLDHCWKPIGFTLLTVYWFNPLIWIAYILLCRDIEGACDEKVIRDMDSSAKKGYSEALVACNTHRRKILACPLAFGEVGVKERIRSVLNYKKPAFWILVTSIVISMIVGVCFLSDPWQNTMAISAIQRATAARITLLEAVEVDPLIGDNPSYMLGRYIGDDYKLYIRMSESGREQEQALKEALGEYTDVVVFEYAAMYKIELSPYAEEVQAALTSQGIDVDDTRVSSRSGNIIVTISNEKDLSRAKDAAAKLEKFSQWIEVRVKTERYDMLTRDYKDPKYRTSVRASEHLMRYFYRQGYVTDYPDYYAGSYIGSDNLYHVVINKTAKNAKANMEEALSAYADDVVYEYASHSRNELQAFCDALSKQLVELGINVTSSGVSETDGVVSISVLEEDVHLAESLINRWAPYPFGHTDIKVEFSAGNYIILE